jgi:hypothetical protein
MEKIIFLWFVAGSCLLFAVVLAAGAWRLGRDIRACDEYNAESKRLSDEWEAGGRKGRPPCRPRAIIR